MANRNGFKSLSLINKNNQNILIYALLVVILSVLLLMLHFVFTKVGDYDVSFTQYALMLALVLLLMIRRKDKTLQMNVISRFKVDLKSIAYSVIIIITLMAVFVSVNLILLAIGEPFTKWQTPSVVLSLVFVLLGCLAEEIGWRGFLLPALCSKFSLLFSAVILGIFWGVWHLNFAQGIGGFLAYTLFITTLSIIIAWVQAKNGYKLLPAVIFHFCVNLFCRLFLFGRMGWQTYIFLSVVFLVIATVLFLADKKTFLTKLNKPNLQEKM